LVLSMEIPLSVKRIIARYLFALRAARVLMNPRGDQKSLILEILRKPFYKQDTRRELELVDTVFRNRNKNHAHPRDTAHELELVKSVLSSHSEISSLPEIARERDLIRFVLENPGLQPVLAELFEKPLYGKDTATDSYHLNFTHFIQEVDKMEAPNILELGARKVNQRHRFAGPGEYVVFDILEDDDVDVVGDIHCLSAYFEEERFDAVFMISVLEHLAIPWKAILEINKVMKPGGLLFISTHPVWPPHALPWDFWRYSKAAFSVLLNERTGFELVKCSEGLPCLVLPFGRDIALMNIHREPANMGVSLVARKTGGFDDELAWNIDVGQILDTMYPES